MMNGSGSMPPPAFRSRTGDIGGEYSGTDGFSVQM